MAWLFVKSLVRLAFLDEGILVFPLSPWISVHSLSHLDVFPIFFRLHACLFYFIMFFQSSRCRTVSESDLNRTLIVLTPLWHQS